VGFKIPVTKDPRDAGQLADRGFDLGSIMNEDQSLFLLLERDTDAGTTVAYILSILVNIMSTSFEAL